MIRHLQEIQENRGLNHLKLKVSKRKTIQSHNCNIKALLSTAKGQVEVITKDKSIFLSMKEASCTRAKEGEDSIKAQIIKCHTTKGMNTMKTKNKAIIQA